MKRFYSTLWTSLRIGMKPFVLLGLVFVLLAGCGLVLDTPADQSSPPPSSSSSSAAGAHYEEVADYLREHGELPDYYLTKQQAREQGWDPQKGNLHDIAPGMSIGGDRFHNREGLLPDSKGRQWFEADIGYDGGHRGAERIVFSNDGLIYYTADHYKTFEQLE